MKKILILLIPCITVYLLIILVNIIALIPFMSWIGYGFLVLPYILTLQLIKWINKRNENIWLVPVSFLVSGVIILFLDMLIFTGISGLLTSLVVFFYMIPCFVIVLIYAIIKSARNR